VKNDVSYNVDVFQYRDWITAAGEGRLSSEMCGTPIREDGAFEPRQTVLHLDAKTPRASVTWSVPPGAAAFRVAMNGEDDGNGTNDFDLSVFQGAAPVSLKPLCSGNGPGQFAFCEIKNPEPGDYTISVTRKRAKVTRR
jgi:hypothetical protein